MKLRFRRRSTCSTAAVGQKDSRPGASVSSCSLPLKRPPLEALSLNLSATKRRFKMPLGMGSAPSGLRRARPGSDSCGHRGCSIESLVSIRLVGKGQLDSHSCYELVMPPIPQIQLGPCEIVRLASPDSFPSHFSDLQRTKFFSKEVQPLPEEQTRGSRAAREFYRAYHTISGSSGECDTRVRSEF